MAMPERESHERLEPPTETDLTAEVPTERAVFEYETERAAFVSPPSLGSTRVGREFSLPGAELLTRDREDDEDEELDDAFYADVREAMGRGTPSLLLGTSTRALDRSLAKIMAAQRAAQRAESEPVATPQSEPVAGPLPAQQVFEVTSMERRRLRHQEERTLWHREGIVAALDTRARTARLVVLLLTGLAIFVAVVVATAIF
jgi:hypothetical protein